MPMGEDCDDDDDDVDDDTNGDDVDVDDDDNGYKSVDGDVVDDPLQWPRSPP